MTHSWKKTRARSAHAPGSNSAMIGSVLLHFVIAVLILIPGEPPPVLPPVYEVRLLAAPLPVPRQRRAPEVVQRPAEQTVPTRPQPQRRDPTPPAPVEVQEEAEPAPRTNPDSNLAPDVEPSTGEDPVTVNTSGVSFPFPEYLRNIVAQVHRRWQKPSGNVSLRAEVQFFIRKDGSVTNFRFVTRSGNFGFDLEAQGAIEAAANSGAFGPLPEGFSGGVLPVSFFFDPSSQR